MIRAGEYSSWEEACARFRWQQPAQYNLAEDVCGRHAVKNPDAVALIYEPTPGRARSYTFAELDQLARRFANVLEALGVQRGDRVAIIMPQRPEALVAHLGIYKAGAVAVPLSKLYAPRALEYRLEHSGTCVVVADAANAAKVDEIASTLPGLRHLLVVDSGVTPVRDFAKHLGRAGERHSAGETCGEDPAMTLYTSGTTGPPKGSLEVHRKLIGFIPPFQLLHNFAPRPHDVYWTPADWAWVGGLFDLLLTAWWCGCPVVGTAQDRFDPEEAFALMARHRVTGVFLPPTALRMMMEVPNPHRFRLALRTITSGGEPVNPEIVGWAREVLDVPVHEFYGQTETTFYVGNCSALFPVRPGSMGRVFPGYRVRIMDEEGREVPDGEVGEIGVHRDAPSVFLEYWKDPDATRQKFAGEWFRTGDTARRDEDGYLWFQGRNDDLIKSAAYRIGPAEVEAAMVTHPGVAEAAAVGSPGPIRGQIVKAFIRLKAGAVASPGLVTEIQETVKQRLAAHQYPRGIEFVEDFPRTTTGKIKRSELREREVNRKEAGERP
ncbi:MAG: acyl-CoA synthetase [Candidatus Methylomirabilia bacterium]